MDALDGRIMPVPTAENVAGLTRVAVILASVKALRSMRATFPIVGIGIETEARPSLRSRHTRSTY